MTQVQDKKITDFIPFNKWDINNDTKFVQFLNVPNIEKLYQRVNLINLNKISDQDYYYIKGCMDTLYALIGVDTPLKKVLDKDMKDFADDRLVTYINAVTSELSASRLTRKVTEEQKDVISENKSMRMELIQHLLNEMEMEQDGAEVREEI